MLIADTGALTLQYSSRHFEAQRSNTPAVARNSAKHTNWPYGVAGTPSSQRRCMRRPSAATVCGSAGSTPRPRRTVSALRLA